MTLTPDYRLSAFLLVGALPVMMWQIWVGIPIALFSVFLGVQTALIRLTFTETSLEVYRGTTCIRTFPYQDWQHWEIYAGLIPVLFYFREIHSIHFLPMLFNPQQLQTCLEQHIPRQSFAAPQS